ncbi:hypothetical protein SDC9_101254 [bioreactor metagenome]|uniref:Flagellar FliJ protein n=1 Tax=bioreactor metagenome TaxID=1076179 RepID=A0A645ANI3_9ZZZZ|nr:hypothetical protein [Oscillospiraceae bacterium]
MKKYNFPLEKVLEYDTHLQNKETDNLNYIKNEYRLLEIKRSYLQENYEFSKNKYQEYCADGITLQKAAVLRTFIGRQQQQLLSLEAEMIDKRKQIEQQIERLLEVTKDKMTIEKLKASSILEYDAMVRKKEEVMIEEFIANKAAIVNT